MTGYGRGEANLNGRPITVELRSVNNRYLDCTVKLPRIYVFAEDAVKSRVQSRISRGKVDVYITIGPSANGDVAISVNKPVADGYYAALKDLRDTYGLRDDISVSLLSRFQDVFLVEKTQEDLEALSADICTVLDLALDDFDAMRTREGEKLCQDVRSRASTIEGLVSRVETRSPGIVADYRAKLVARMMLVMGGGNAALDLLFLYPLDMGIGGAAWASVIATAAACAMGFCWLCGRDSSFHLGWSGLTAREDWREIAATGSPSALNNLLQTLRMLTVNALLMGAGGSELVAVFTAVNCISAFSLAVVDGVPQAASAMLGIYSGERDNDSAALLIRRELRTGLFCCGIFAAAAILGADAIALAYGLPGGSLRPAMVCLSAGMFPALGCSILSGYYNISGHVGWANAIITCRVFLAAAVSLCAALALGLSPWWFLILSEAVTLALWALAVSLFRRRHPERTRYLLMDRSLEEGGQVANFSVAGDTAHICEASGKIAGFCRENRMEPRQVMRFSLAIEEVMTRIVQENPDTAVHFDVRVFSVQGTMGIRIRYDGRAYDPFDPRRTSGDAYLGIQLIAGMMEQVVYQRTFGVNTVQLLL